MSRRSELGMGAVNPHRNAHDALRRADLIRAEANKLRNLPVTDAAQRIKVNRAEQEQARQQTVRRARQLDPFERDPHSPPALERHGPARGL